MGQRGGILYFKLLFLSDGPIKLAHCPKKKKKQRTGEAPHLMNRRGILVYILELSIK
jgi:hypothetical protein